MATPPSTLTLDTLLRDLKDLKPYKRPPDPFSTSFPISDLPNWEREYRVISWTNFPTPVIRPEYAAIISLNPETYGPELRTPSEPYSLWAAQARAGTRPGQRYFNAHRLRYRE